MAYLVPGYQTALEQDDPDAEAFETVMPQCRQSLDGFGAAATATTSAAET